MATGADAAAEGGWAAEEGATGAAALATGPRAEGVVEPSMLLRTFRSILCSLVRVRVGG